MQKIKLLTLNLHCLEEPHIHQNQEQIVDFIQHKNLDLICLQEVAQSEQKALLYDSIKEDNYAYTLQQLLLQKGHHYHLHYLPIKRAFNKYDEGLAILSKYPISIVDTPLLSVIDDYSNWKRRQALITYIEALNLYVTTTHLGWSDGVETWEHQLDVLQNIVPLDTLHVLTGDFNVTPNSKEYAYLKSYNWYNILEGTPLINHPTHIEDMDIHKTTSTIDYMMTNKPVELLESEIVFTENKVSDHYGIYVQLKR